MINNESWGAENAPSKEVQQAYAHNSVAIQGLQELRDIALYLAKKYRWDPFLGPAHEEYLTMLNKILVECHE